jgi:hypothetical protein
LENERARQLATESASFSLLVRGEFRVRNGIILISLYAAAILSIPLLLNSIFSISSLTLGLSQYATAQEILSSIYFEIASSYVYVTASLFAGFIVACFLIGRSFARDSAKLTRMLLHSGGETSSVRRVLAFLLLLVALCSSLLAFCLSSVLTSATLYAFSIILHYPFFLPGLDLTYALYLVVALSLSFGALLVGALGTINGT